MKRSEFIQSLGLGASGLLLPKHLLKQQPIQIYDNYVRGIQFYQFKKTKNAIKEGDELQLMRETDNVHDQFAIAIYHQENKLGYIAAYENIVLANMLDAGTELKAFVSQLNLDIGYDYALSVKVIAELVVTQPNIINTEVNNERADDASDLYRDFI
ncbi:MAG: HIRAN domain-containing protein [Salibacteraceae bacterium]